MFESAERLDRAFGDPRDGHNPYGFHAAVARDEHGGFPDALCAAAREAGLHTSYLPAGLGGSLHAFDEVLTLVRTAARRDVAIMPSAMISITAVFAVIVGGSPEQRRRVADLVRRGGTIGFALSEEHSGSDVLAGTCRLEPDGDGYRLTGDKWMVGLGTRCDALLVVVRTGERGPGAFTAVLLDRAALPAGTVEVSPPVPTSGMRGVDFAHYRFHGCLVPAEAVVGKVGTGLDAALRAQQVVRTMSAAGNLACADTTMRLVLDFALRRTVGRRQLVEVPHARRELALAAAALLAVDVTALAAARALHVAPGRFVVPSSVVKRVAAEESDALIGRCAAVLGARSVIADGPAAAVQKARRDNAVVRHFDTSPVGNLRTVAAQLPLIARAAGAEGIPDDLAAVFELRAELPELRPAALDLTARGRDDVVAGLPAVAAQARPVLAEQAAGRAAEQAAGRAAEQAAGRAAELVAGRAAELVAELDGELAALLRRAETDSSIDVAERFCLLHAAASAVHLWWFNRTEDLFGQPAGSAGWLTGCLAYLLARARGADARLAADDAAGALDAVLRLHAEDRLFSAVPVRLCGACPPGPDGRTEPDRGPDRAPPAKPWWRRDQGPGRGAGPRTGTRRTTWHELTS